MTNNLVCIITDTFKEKALPKSLIIFCSETFSQWCLMTIVDCSYPRTPLGDSHVYSSVLIDLTHTNVSSHIFSKLFPLHVKKLTPYMGTWSVITRKNQALWINFRCFIESNWKTPLSYVIALRGHMQRGGIWPWSKKRTAACGGPLQVPIRQINLGFYAREGREGKQAKSTSLITGGKYPKLSN